CASCKHSWHQDPDEAEAGSVQPIDQAADEPKAEADDEESFAEATLIEPRSGPEAEERAFEEATLDDEHPAALDEAAAVPVEADETDYSDVRPAMEAAEAAPASPESDWQEPPHAEAQTDDFT